MTLELVDEVSVTDEPVYDPESDEDDEEDAAPFKITRGFDSRPPSIKSFSESMPSLLLALIALLPVMSLS